jgi:RNA polymerase sigma-70 factor (TIGR02943 family)
MAATTSIWATDASAMGTGNLPFHTDRRVTARKGRTSMDDGSDLHAAFAAMRPLLMRMAMLQLRNRSWAEDVVSETLIAALEQAPRFEARSKLSTWVIGILKHKIIDQMRRRAREVSIDAQDEDEQTADIENMYHDDGSQVAAPADWGDPEQALTQQQFLEVLQACLACLPANHGRAFMMREWLDYETPDICASLGITAGHCNVMLFRARMRLRECVEQKWFAGRVRPHLADKRQRAAVGSA